jgi:cell division protein FtsZ
VSGPEDFIMLEFVEESSPLRFEFSEEGEGSSLKFQFEERQENTTRIRVMGIGGGGGNAVNRMHSSHFQDVEFAIVNTDLQALQSSNVPQRIQIGNRLTKGLGAGANPEIGRKAALEDKELIIQALEGIDLVFLTAGLGGGTGTGAAPVIGEVARELGILTIGVVTKPFSFEGSKRMTQAEEGLKELQGKVDTLITISNERLLEIVEKPTSLVESFKIADEVLTQGVRSIVDLITVPGLINLDLADLKTIMQEAGSAMIGIGKGKEEGRALTAAREALSSSLLEETSIEGAKGVIFNLSGGLDLNLSEVEEVASLIREVCDKEANIIFGATIDKELGEEIKVIIIATKFNLKEKNLSERKRIESLALAGKSASHTFSSSREDLDIPTFLRRKRQREGYVGILTG